MRGKPHRVRQIRTRDTEHQVEQGTTQHVRFNIAYVTYDDLIFLT